jgi:hypothetical protein
MKNSVALLSCLLACLVTTLGCHKSGTSGCPTGGGKGGTITLSVIPEHSNYFVDSCMVYIKYGTTDAPLDGTYDDSAKVVLQDTTPVATFSGLSQGNYYVLGVGYHQLLSERVKGGVPCTICSDANITEYLPTYPY